MNKPLPSKEELNALRKQIALADVVEEKLGDLAKAFRDVVGLREQFFKKEDIANQPTIYTKLSEANMDRVIEDSKYNAKQWIDMFGVDNFAFNAINNIRVLDQDTLIQSKGYRFGNSPEHEEKTKQFWGVEMRIIHLIDVNTGLSRFSGMMLTYGDVDSTTVDLYMDIKFYRLMKLAVPHYQVHRSFSENIFPLGRCKVLVRTFNNPNKFYKTLNQFVAKHIGEELIISGFGYLNYKSLY